MQTTKIDPTRIRKVYSGEPGCGCGCNGAYFTDRTNINRIVKLMNASGRVQLQDAGTPFAMYYVESDTQYLWAYTTA